MGILRLRAPPGPDRKLAATSAGSGGAWTAQCSWEQKEDPPQVQGQAHFVSLHTQAWLLTCHEGWTCVCLTAHAEQCHQLQVTLSPGVDFSMKDLCVGRLS